MKFIFEVLHYTNLNHYIKNEIQMFFVLHCFYPIHIFSRSFVLIFLFLFRSLGDFSSNSKISVVTVLLRISNAKNFPQAYPYKCN